jgi:hypothetical protein
LFTIPFILVANYHSTETVYIQELVLYNFQIFQTKFFCKKFELLENQDQKSNESTFQAKETLVNTETINKIKRGLGTDLSLMSSMVFVAQFILSFFIGSLMKYFAKSAVFYTASTLSFIAFLTSNKVLYLD